MSFGFDERAHSIIEAVSEKVKARFVAAGWHPGRQVTVSSSVPADHPAAAILAEFGGLMVGSCDEGEECATSDLAFEEITYKNSDIGVWNGLLKSQLVGVAEVHHRHGELYVASDGRCFGNSTVHDAFYFEGASLMEAVERLLLGRHARPMLRPDQSSVTLYGIEYTADSPETYHYR